VEEYPPALDSDPWFGLRFINKTLSYLIVMRIKTCIGETISNGNFCEEKGNSFDVMPAFDLRRPPRAASRLWNTYHFYFSKMTACMTNQAALPLHLPLGNSVIFCWLLSKGCQFQCPGTHKTRRGLWRIRKRPKTPAP
jgi:hypothetical protein